MLVWTNQPTKQDCLDVGIGEHSFHCYRKDKFGMLLLAGSDARCRFKWADITHPGCASDYTAWVTSGLGMKLTEPDQDIIAPGLTIFGDNAFVETQYMSTPIPGKKLSRYDNAYNFYFSQLLRITVERAFGILVHRFGILCGPILLSIKKVPALVMCLMKLHNFYIDHYGRKVVGGLEEDEAFVHYRAFRSDHNAVPVTLNCNRVPEALLGLGSKFRQNYDWLKGRNLPGARIPAETSDSFRSFLVVFCVTSDITEPKTSGFLATGMYRNFRSSDWNRIASFVNFTKTLSPEGVPRLKATK
jgi:hypothetical protein